jgi:hypothetical protein
MKLPTGLAIDNVRFLAEEKYMSVFVRRLEFKI